MDDQNRQIDWDDIESNMIMQWYFVSKIMKQMFTGTFPYFTFQELIECIYKDPEYKKTEES